MLQADNSSAPTKTELNIILFTIFILVYLINFTVPTRANLEKVEMSQSLDSNSRTIPSLRWSLYEQSGLADSLTVGEDFTFTRNVNFLQHFNQVLSGQFNVKQDSQFTVTISNGSLYTLPILDIAALNATQLVIIEKFKTRWMRRTFKKNK